MRPVLAIAGLSVLGFACNAEPIYAIHHQACAPDATPQPPPYIAVGCEILDAELGCRSSSRITVQVEFVAPEGSTASLRVENAAPAGLSLSNARLAETSTIVLKPGVAKIAGFSGVSERVPFLVPDVRFPPTAPEGNETGAVITQTTAARLVIRMLADAVVVRQVEVQQIYHPCTAMLQAGDQILQSGFLSTKNAVALIDGRRTPGCVTMEGHLGPAIMMIGNVLAKHDPVANVDCAARATIFSDSHAVAYRPTVPWTDSATDNLTVTSAYPVIEPVKFWLLYDPCVSGPQSCTPAVAASVKNWGHTLLTIADNTFRGQFGGIGFNNLGTIDLTATNSPVPAATVQAAWNPPGCSTQTDTRQTLVLMQAVSGDTDPHQLNVFFVQDLLTSSGEWCGVHDQGGVGANTILISSTHQYPHTVAHEIGHALLNSVSHAVENVDGFTRTTASQNLMTVGSLGDQLTIGQLFRANLDNGSAINRHGVRTGDTVSCDAPPGTECPELAFDVRPR